MLKVHKSNPRSKKILVEKKREKERTNEEERHVSGQEMRFFGGRVVRFKKAEKTDVLGRSE